MWTAAYVARAEQHICTLGCRILNLGIAIFAGSGMSQLLCTVLIISYYACMVAQNMPYDTQAMNFLDVGTSMSAVFMLLLTGLEFDPQAILKEGVVLRRGLGQCHRFLLDGHGL